MTTDEMLKVESVYDALRAENERLRAALLFIAERCDDIEVSAYAFSALMNMK